MLLIGYSNWNIVGLRNFSKIPIHVFLYSFQILPAHQDIQNNGTKEGGPFQGRPGTPTLVKSSFQT